MSAEKKVGTLFWVKVDTDYDVFDAFDGFEGEYINELTNDITPLPLEWSEVIRNIESNEGIIKSFSNCGTNTIEVSGEIFDGDVISDQNNNKYYIKEKVGSTLTLNSTLKNDLNEGDVVFTVGNTGLYKLPLIINETGDYTIIIRHPKENVQNMAFSLTISDITLNDLKELLEGGISTSNDVITYKGFV